MKLRTRQLLKLYNKSYTTKEQWKAKRLAAIQAQHPKAALMADNAASYWEKVSITLRSQLLFMQS